MPVAVNGVAMPFMDIIASVGTIAGDHGVGRIDMIENRLVGIKTREVYEAPAAVVLHLAHGELESFVSPRDLQRVKQEMAARYADMVYDGAWYSPVREAMDAFVAKVQERVTGTLRVKLFKGSAQVVGRQSPFALYDHGLATYGEGDTFDHGAAAGFIKLHGLPIETAARMRGPGGLPAGPGKADVMPHLWSGRFDEEPDAVGLLVRRVARLRPAALRRRRDGQPRVGRGARARRVCSPKPTRRRSPPA